MFRVRGCEGIEFLYTEIVFVLYKATSFTLGGKTILSTSGICSGAEKRRRSIGRSKSRNIHIKRIRGITST